MTKYDTHAKALAAVQQDGYALRYVTEQTPGICLAAVQQNGHALEYVKDAKLRAKMAQRVKSPE